LKNITIDIKTKITLETQ